MSKKGSNLEETVAEEYSMLPILVCTLFHKVRKMVPRVIGSTAHIAEIDGLAYGYKGGYTGKIDGKPFDMHDDHSLIGARPVVIVYGLVKNLYSETSQADKSSAGYGFVYAVTLQGQCHVSLTKKQRNASRGIETPHKAAHLAIAVFLPKQHYETLVGNELKDVDELIRSVLPKEPWHDYLAQGGFFTRPRIIAEI